MLDSDALDRHNTRRKAMKYYYLNSEKKTQGPYSAQEMQELRAGGIINDDTLAAVAGDSKWKPLSEILITGESVEKCSTWNNEPAKCPYCGHEFGGEDVPSVCPECQRTIKVSEMGLWACFIYAIRNSFNYKGRATRKEFWGFYLFNYIFGLILSQITSLFITEQTTLFNTRVEEAENVELVYQILWAYMTDPAVLMTIVVSQLYALFMLFPFLAVSVRRLHDVGRSAFAVFLGVALNLALIASAGYLFASLMENPEIENFVNRVICLGVSCALFLIVSLYLFVLTLVPGKPGPNKYGPASR